MNQTPGVPAAGRLRESPIRSRCSPSTGQAADIRTCISQGSTLPLGRPRCHGLISARRPARFSQICAGHTYAYCVRIASQAGRSDSRRKMLMQQRPACAWRGPRPDPGRMISWCWLLHLQLAPWGTRVRLVWRAKVAQCKHVCMNWGKRGPGAVIPAGSRADGRA